MTKKEDLKKFINSGKLLTADFEEYRVFQNPRIFRTDSLRQQLIFPFPWPPPHVVDGPPEFLEADTGHVVSWLETDSREDSSPHRKEMTVVEMSSSNFFTIEQQRRRYNLPLDNVPDLSGVVLPLVSGIALLPPISGLPLPASPSQGFLLVFSLGIPPVLSAPALGAGPLPQHVFWPSWPRSARRRNQTCY